MGKSKILLFLDLLVHTLLLDYSVMSFEMVHLDNIATYYLLLKSSFQSLDVRDGLFAHA